MKGDDFYLNLIRQGLFIVPVIGVLLIIIPIPVLLLDILMGLNILLAILILFIVLYIKKATDFSLFPSIVLVSTVFCLIVNVCAARLIWIKGADFDGRLIRFVSSLIVGPEADRLIIGLIIFLAIATVHTLIIAKGAMRGAEVAARFLLDSLQGKQMAIDAEYSSGVIDQNEAVCRKQALQQESDFFGALDGASHFMSGIAKVGIFITAVIIIAGTLIDHLIREIALSDAIATYFILAIGSGILFMIPASIVAIAVGTVVTRLAFRNDD